MASATLCVGQWLDGTPYRIAKVLGVGGMGEVYEVDHSRTGTRRALKVVRARVLREQRPLLTRFMREANVLRNLYHPNIVTVYENGVLSDGRPYYAMQLLHGSTWREIIRQRAPVEMKEAIGMAAQVLDGLEAMHRSGVVHRDIKPSNLFWDVSGVAVVIDLGIAKVCDRSITGPHTNDGMVVGTLAYMAPEQFITSEVDGRADVYAMGLVLLELVTGAKAQEREAWTDAFEVLRSSGHASVAQVLRVALSRDPNERYPSAKGFAESLRAIFPAPSVRKRRVMDGWCRMEPARRRTEY